MSTAVHHVVNVTLRDALSLHALGCPVEVETEHGQLLTMCWESGRLHRLLANHPERHIAVPEWALPDFDVLTGRTWPVPILDPVRSAMVREDQEKYRGARDLPSLERVVQALASAGCMPVVRGAWRWRACCPVCKLRGKLDRRVYLERNPETGRERLSTFCHCRIADILAVIGLGRREARAWNG